MPPAIICHRHRKLAHRLHAMTLRPSPLLHVFVPEVALEIFLAGELAPVEAPPRNRIVMSPCLFGFIFAAEEVAVKDNVSHFGGKPRSALSATRLSPASELRAHQITLVFCFCIWPRGFKID